MNLSKTLLLVIFALFATAALANDQLAFQSSIRHRRGSLGIGYGLCYAGLGFNGDYNVTSDIAVSGSIGTFGYVGGYELGTKYYFMEFDATFRPMVSLWYGINAMTIARPSETSGLPNVTEGHAGFTGGAGAQWMFSKTKRHGFDVNLLYIISNNQEKRLKQLESQGYGEFTRGSRLLFSFGYRYAF